MSVKIKKKFLEALALYAKVGGLASVGGMGK